MRIPFFHYTYLDNLAGIVSDARVASRGWQQKTGGKFTDISIDSRQPVRSRLGLLNYVPLFPGFYALFRGYDLNGFLMAHYDEPKVQNKSFYGSFNKVLQFKAGIRYEDVITFLVNDEVVYNLADKGRVRFLTDIAVKPGVRECSIASRLDLSARLKENISGSNISGEIDLLDDGKTSIAFPADVEAIIVDNGDVEREVRKMLKQSRRDELPEIFVSEHPRNDPGDDDFA